MSAPRPRVAIIGLGLIGGSLGMALRGAGWTVGFTDDAVPEDAARAAGAADDAVGSAKLETWDADLVVLATPLDVAADLLVTLPFGRAAVTSVCSLMVPLLEPAASRQLRFIAGHPMAGSERSGLDAASADLFRGCSWFIEQGRDEPALSRCINDAGAHQVAVDPHEHDDALAITSHLPQLLSTALGSAVEQDFHRLEPFIGEGLKTFLRLSGSGFDSWNPVLGLNSESIGAAEERLAAAADRILAGEGEEDFRRARALWARVRKDGRR